MTSPSDWLLKISPCLRIAGSMAHPVGWVEAMRVIYEHELVLFKGSAFEVEIEGGKFKCPADSFLIVPPGMRHITREIGGAPGRRHWIHFDWHFQGAFPGRPVMTYCPARPDVSSYHFAPDFVPEGILQGSLRSARTVFEMFRRTESLFNSDSGRDRLLSRAAFLELLLEILSSGSVEASVNEEEPATQIVSRMRTVLSELAAQPARRGQSLQRTLEDLGLSYAHQCRLFKQHCGISPVEYVAELRMTRMKALLRDTSLSVSKICEMEGFDNPGYLCRFFRKRAGSSPTDYRRSVKRGE